MKNETQYEQCDFCRENAAEAKIIPNYLRGTARALAPARHRELATEALCTECLEAENIPEFLRDYYVFSL